MRDRPPVRRPQVRAGANAVLPRPVGEVLLQVADPDRLPFDPLHADHLALVFLRADAAGDGGEEVGLHDLLIGGLRSPFFRWSIIPRMLISTGQ